MSRITTDHRKLVDAIIAGVPAEQVKDRMIELDGRRKNLERQFSTIPARDPLRIHPGMARSYLERIGQLIRGLAEAERMDEANEALRALVEKIELVPVSAEGAVNGKPGLAIHLHGALASLLRLACRLPVHEMVGAGTQMQKPRVLRGVAVRSMTDQLTMIFKPFILFNNYNLLRSARPPYLPELKCAV